MSEIPADAIIGAVEGYIPFRTYRTWYRSAGDKQGRLPILLLHGGPGFPSDYLEPLFALSRARRVIVYDQLGCGRSDQPHDPSLWSLDLFLEELSVVRRALGLDQVHLFGHSWGGMLALEHALSGAPGIASLLLANTLASVPAWRKEANRLIDGLALEQRDALRRAMQSGRYADPGVQEAVAEFNRRHLTRLDPLPDCLLRSLHPFEQNQEVYTTMWGPCEPAPTGRLAMWDVSRRLSEISTPTLVIGGRHDEMTPATTLALHEGIPYSEYVLFEESSHTPHLEEGARCIAVVEDFLARVEAYL